MTYSEAIELLDKQKWALIYTSDIQVSLDTAEHYIQDIFGTTSTQLSNYRRLKSDFTFSKIYLHDANKLTANEKKFQKRALDQINGLISYLREKEKLDGKEQERKQINKRKLEEERKKEEEDKKAQLSPLKISNIPVPEPKLIQQAAEQKKLPPPKKIMKEKSHYIISHTTFWAAIGIASTIIGAAYFLGNQIGQSKFDKEKNDLYEDNQRLNKEILLYQDSSKNLKDTISYLKSDLINEKVKKVPK